MRLFCEGRPLEPRKPLLAQAEDDAELELRLSDETALLTSPSSPSLGSSNGHGGSSASIDGSGGGDKVLRKELDDLRRQLQSLKSQMDGTAAPLPQTSPSLLASNG